MLITAFLTFTFESLVLGPTILCLWPYLYIKFYLVCCWFFSKSLNSVVAFGWPLVNFSADRLKKVKMFYQTLCKIKI